MQKEADNKNIEVGNRDGEIVGVSREYYKSWFSNNLFLDTFPDSFRPFHTLTPMMT